MGLDQNLPLRNVASRLLVPALSRTTHPFAASGSEEPSPKIEFNGMVRRPLGDD
jgi:hypothetical protein